MNYKMDTATFRRLKAFIKDAPKVVTVDVSELVTGLQDSLNDLETAKHRIAELEQEIESRKKGMIRLSEQLGEKSKEGVLLELADKAIAVGKKIDIKLLPSGGRSRVLGEEFVSAVVQYDEEKTRQENE